MKILKIILMLLALTGVYTIVTNDTVVAFTSTVTEKVQAIQEERASEAPSQDELDDVE